MLLVLERVEKRFGRVRALDGVSIRVFEGERVALVGANGAGKTTLLRTAATLLRPTRGTVRIAGLDPVEDGPACRAVLGFLPDSPHLYEAMTVRENLGFLARAHALPADAAQERSGLLLGRLGLGALAETRVQSLSRGNVQRAALATAFLHGPRVLLLDEPTASLDAAGQDAFWRLAAEACGSGACVLLATHDGALAARCDRAVLLRAGRVAEEIAPASPERVSRALAASSAGGA